MTLEIELPEGAIVDYEVAIVSYIAADGCTGLLYRMTPDVAYSAVIGTTTMALHDMCADAAGDHGGDGA